jgi:hypothetical protein
VGTHAFVSYTGWETCQRQTPHGAVESEQRVVLEVPVVGFDADGASALGEHYWREVKRATWGLVRPRRHGESVQLRVLGRGPVLLSFAAPALEATPNSARCRFPISGGLLARRPVGELSIAQVDRNWIELRSAIRGFYPSLAAHEGRRDWTGTLYNSVQSRIHVAISRRYFARLAAGKVL